MKNGVTWYDTDNNVIHAHGGWILKVEDTFFWYGENRTEDNYVSCYSSKDLKNWTFRNNILTTKSQTVATRVRADLKLLGDNGKKVNIERPKVLFNENTGKYVMWAHYENGENYKCAAAAVASCDTPDGDFVYHGSFNPYGNMSRDCTVFTDKGKTYFASAARDNADMNIYLLQEDYLNVEKQVGSFWSNEFREAPAFIRKDDRVYCFSSFCTGWAPNQGKYAYTDDVENGFGLLRNFGDDTTFHSQPAFILKITGTEETSYIYVGDRWDASDYHNSTYTWYPVKFYGDGRAELIETEEINIDLVSGRIL